MLQKVLVMINADEMVTPADVAHSIFVKDAINYMSVAWKDACGYYSKLFFFEA